ncbi:MAG: hypothetical protein ABI614_02510 [Planctomycetota bacterium]
MKPAMICAAVLVASLICVNESQAQYGFGGGFGGGFSSYGYGGFGYGAPYYSPGAVPAPPYYALHPPVYYSHEIIRRPIGDSPYAYFPQRPAAAPVRQLSRNPFVPDVTTEDGSQQTTQANDSVAQVMRNPFYDDDQSSLVASGLIVNPYFAKPEALVAQTGN